MVVVFICARDDPTHVVRGRENCKRIASLYIRGRTSLIRRHESAVNSRFDGPYKIYTPNSSRIYFLLGSSSQNLSQSRFCHVHVKHHSFRHLRMPVVSYKGKISHFDPPSLYSCRVRSLLPREIIIIIARRLSRYSYTDLSNCCTFAKCDRIWENPP